MPTVRAPSRAATVAMMIGSSSIDPAGSANTHSPSIDSEAAIVMQATSPRASTSARRATPFSDTQGPKMISTPSSISSWKAWRTARNDPFGSPCTARTTNSTGRSSSPCSANSSATSSRERRTFSS